MTQNSAIRFAFVAFLLVLVQLPLFLYLLYLSPSSRHHTLSSTFFKKVFSSLQNSHVYQRDTKRCIVYDRPPRTGSTTISKTLHQCLTSLGYKQPPWMGHQARADDIHNMLHQPFASVALVSRHFFMNASSLQQLYTGCDSLLYVSSTAPMVERVWSAMKYRQLGRHGNGTLSEQQTTSALADVQQQQAVIQLLNAYPFWKNMHTALDTRAINRPQPDYVIRKSHLIHDLLRLLQTLKCDTQVKSYNVHTAQLRYQLKQLKVEDDDALHRRLLRRAERHNRKGLTKALTFSKR
eukprot:TRINITY_DN1472_c0_g1_i1.p1 TRINITY_DN1472_c0_g1~~TRINITY_DN1472_c0_g1_i1.p1  ORF type:complete len:293 (-),score=49.15 TRINITY_DN1472_c0_g1_i1:1626-2504(-)